VISTALTASANALPQQPTKPPADTGTSVISGTVTDGLTGRRVHAVRPATDGGYRAADLPPGDYFVAAVRRAAPDAWLDPSFLERLAVSAIRVTVGDGAPSAVDLRVADVR
jgi:hypothetical protein